MAKTAEIYLAGLALIVIISAGAYFGGMMSWKDATSMGTILFIPLTFWTVRANQRDYEERKATKPAAAGGSVDGQS